MSFLFAAAHFYKGITTLGPFERGGNDEAARHLNLDFANLGSGKGVFELDGKRRTFANIVHQCRAETSDAGSGLVANAGVDDAS